MNIILYVLVVLIWGTTWIALKWQLGIVAIPLSIAYRFALAALVLFALLIWKRQLVRPRGVAIRLVAAQGVCLFCLNFVCFLNASETLPSGLVAVVFSTSTLWNALLARVIHAAQNRTAGYRRRRARAGRPAAPVLAAGRRACG
jgi:drug/metabolite transporter (DMT)-like permease